jgi:hypothetical protein
MLDTNETEWHNFRRQIKSYTLGEILRSFLWAWISRQSFTLYYHCVNFLLSSLGSLK